MQSARGLDHQRAESGHKAGRFLDAPFRPLELLFAFSLVMGGLGMRLFYLAQIRGVSGGDAFNFLLIAQQMINGGSPFIEKRLPFYPILLIPGLLTPIDPILWGRLVNVLAVVGSALLLLVISQQLKFQRTVVYLAMALFLANRFGIFLSLRPLSNTLFAFMVLLSFFAFLSSRSRRSLGVLGLILGLTAMTRHEGFLVAPVIFLALVGLGGSRGERWRRLWPSALVFALVVAPFFISNLIRFGNPLYSGYLADPGVTRASGLSEFISHGDGVLRVLGSLWANPDSVDPVERASAPVLWVLSAIGLAIYLRSPSLNRLTFLGIMITQALLFSWIRPGARFLQAVYPFMALLLAIGAHAPYSWVQKRSPVAISREVRPAAIRVASLLFIGVVLFASRETSRAVAQHNHDQRGVYLLQEAIRYAAGLEGRVGIESDFIEPRVYLRDRAVVFEGTDPVQPEPDTLLNWAQANDLTYVLRYAAVGVFPPLDDPVFQERFELVKRWAHTPAGTESKGIEAELYHVVP